MLRLGAVKEEDWSEGDNAEEDSARLSHETRPASQRRCAYEELCFVFMGEHHHS